MLQRPLVLDWKGLKKLGWPYSRTHTFRMMFDEEYADDPFPACHKLRPDRNSHPLWVVREVLAYFETHGLRVTSDWYAPE